MHKANGITENRHLLLPIVVLMAIASWAAIAFILHPQPLQSALPANLIPGGFRSTPLEAFTIQILQKLFAADTLARLVVILAAGFTALQLGISSLASIKGITNRNELSASLWRQFSGFEHHHTRSTEETGYSNSSDHAMSQPVSITLVCRTRDGIRLRLTNLQLSITDNLVTQEAHGKNKDLKKTIIHEINGFIRKISILELLESPGDDKRNNTVSHSVDSIENLDLQPRLIRIPTARPISYKIISIPDIQLENAIISRDFSGSVLRALNKYFHVNITVENIPFVIISIEKCELLPAGASKKLEAILKSASIAKSSNQPRDMALRQQEIRQLVVSKHLHEIETRLDAEQGTKIDSSLLSYFLSYFQKAAEDGRYDGQPVPGEIFNLIERLEKILAQHEQNQEKGHEII